MKNEKLEMLSWKIRQLRRQNKMTQIDLANKLGVTAATIAMWENGRRGIDTSTLIKLSNLFNVTTDWLLSTEDKTLSIKLPQTENTITIIGRNGSFNTYVVDDSKVEAIRKFTEVLAEQNELNKKNNFFRTKPTIETERNETLSKSDYYYISKKAREFIIKNSVSSLPVNLEKLCLNNNWVLISYIELKKYGNIDNNILNNDWGLTIITNDFYLILFDDKISEGAKRFTIAHEIGHIVLNHKDKVINEKLRETQASMFAARLLMPMCVLYECKVKNPEEIQKMCLVSITSASYRFKRLQLLKQRNKFYSDKNEVLVYRLFKPFIKKYNKKNKISVFKKFYNWIINIVN